MSLFSGIDRCNLKSLAGVCAMATCLASLAGCGGPSYSEVSGVVTCNGKPLPTGRISFYCNGENKSVLITEIQDGSYRLSNVELGEAFVSIETFRPSRSVRIHNAPPDAQSPLMSTNPIITTNETYVPIPMKYASAKTSGLTATITESEQVANFDLEFKSLK